MQMGSHVQDLIQKSGLELGSLSSQAASSGTPSQSNAAASGRQSQTLETVDQMKDQLFQAAKMGWKVGAYVQPKDHESISTWKISAFEGSIATLVERVGGHDGGEIKVELPELMKKYRVHKGKVTELLEGWSFTTNLCSPLSSAAWKYDIVKSSIHIAIYEQYKLHEHHVEHLEVLQHPLTVKVKAAFKAKTLRLVAASCRLDRKSTKDSICVGNFDLIESEVHMNSHFVSPMVKDGEAAKSPWVCPFWAVTTCKDNGNMDLINEKVNVHGIDVLVPILINTSDLKPNTELTWVKKSKPTLKSKDSKVKGESSKRQRTG